MKQEFAPPMVPRATALKSVGSISLRVRPYIAARIQAKVLFGHTQLQSREAMGQGGVPLASLRPATRTRNYRTKRGPGWLCRPRHTDFSSRHTKDTGDEPSKLLPTVGSSFHFGPSRGRTRKSCPVLTREGQIIETSDVTWEAPRRSLPPLPSLVTLETAATEGGISLATAIFLRRRQLLRVADNRSRHSPHAFPVQEDRKQRMTGGCGEGTM